MNALFNGILIFLQVILPLEFFLSDTGSQDRHSTHKSDDLRIMVISDTHLMAPELIKEDGSAFADYIAHDRKMLRESPELMEEMTQEILQNNPQIVLITGDLTKDGETVSHLMLRDTYLKRLRDAGIQVYVIPGNHDVDNPHAVEFLGDTMQRVATPTAEEFAEIYKDYGYGQAMERDNHSLSYVVQISDNTRLLCLDACKYEENSYEENTCVTGGRLKAETIEFIKEQGRKAKADGMRLMAMIHHGVVEHWKWQEKVMGEYLVDEWKEIAKLLAKQDIEVTFTGHFHAQDITRRGKLYDIETGSLVSYPSPYRIVCLHDNELSIESRRLTGRFITTASQTGETVTPDFSLDNYSKQFACDGITNIVNDMLPKETPSQLRSEVCSEVCEAYVAHLEGDETMPADKTPRIKEVSGKLKKHSIKLAYIFTHIVKYIQTDKNTEDNNVTIQLKKQ